LTITTTRDRARAGRSGEPLGRASYVAWLLDNRASARRAEGALRLPADVLEAWSELLAQRYRALPAREQAAIREAVADYRELTDEQEQLDADEALRFLEDAT